MDEHLTAIDRRLESIYLQQSELILSRLLAKQSDEHTVTQSWLTEVTRCGDALKKAVCGMIDDIWKNEEYAKLVVDRCYGKNNEGEVEIEFEGKSRKIHPHQLGTHDSSGSKRPTHTSRIHVDQSSRFDPDIPKTGNYSTSRPATSSSYSTFL